MDDKIIFTGFTNEAQELMQLCDCLILATTCETFGLVLAEAMRGNIAVIATNQGGPLEIIDDKKTGLLFERGNSGDLAMKIEMLKDNEFKNVLAYNGTKKAKEYFDSKKQFDKLDAILNSLSNCNIA